MRTRTHHAPLERLTGLDCPEPYCRANGHGTGFLVELDGRAYVEARCADCGEVWTVWWPTIDELVAAVAAASTASRDEVVAAWVARHPRGR